MVSKPIPTSKPEVTTKPPEGYGITPCIRRNETCVPNNPLGYVPLGYECKEFRINANETVCELRCAQGTIYYDIGNGTKVLAKKCGGEHGTTDWLVQYYKNATNWPIVPGCKNSTAFFLSGRKISLCR